MSIFALKTPFFSDLRLLVDDIPRLEKFNQGQAALSVYTEGDIVHMARVQILSLLPRNKVSVYFVDEGGEDVVDESLLHEMPLCFQRFPIFAIKFKDISIDELQCYVPVERLV
jgi:hypothetical protein